MLGSLNNPISGGPSPFQQADVKRAQGWSWALEKQDLVLVDTLLAAWVLDLAAPAAFLYKSDQTAARWILAAIAVAVAAGIFLEVRHRWQNKITVLWVIMVPMILAHILFLSGAAASVFFVSVREFAIDKFAVYQVGTFPDGMARFASISEPRPDGQVLVSPIDILVLLQLRSLTSELKYIRNYKIEALIGDAWEPLCRVPLAPDPPFYLSTRSKAREVILTPFIPGANDSPFAPREIKTFWSAWACAQRCDLSKARLRLTVIDITAHQEIVEFPSDKDTPKKEFDVPTGVGIGSALNLDPAKETAYAREDCPHRQE